MEAGQHCRDCWHTDVSGIEPWETDRNVTIMAQTRKTLLSPFQDISAMATGDGLGQGDMSKLTKILVTVMTNISSVLL